MGSNRNVEYQITLRDRISGRLQRIDRQTRRTTNSFNVMNRVIGTISVAAMVQFGTTATKTAAKYESLTKAIEFSSGNALQARNNMEFLRITVDELKLNYEATAQGFKTFSGAMRTSGFSAKKQRDIFLKVAKASKVMQLSGDATKGVFLALSQIMSKGKVQAEELRGQIGERLPGAFSIAAKAMGKTEAELNKMMETGQLLAKDFLPKFADQLDKDFAGGVEDAVNSINSQLNKLENGWEKFLTSTGKNVEKSGIITGLSKMLDAANSLNKLQDDYNAFQQSRFGKTQGDLLNPFGVSSEENKFFKARQAVEKHANWFSNKLNKVYNKLDAGKQDIFKVKKAEELRVILDKLDKEYTQRKDKSLKLINDKSSLKERKIIAGKDKKELQDIRKKIELYKVIQERFGEITTKVKQDVDTSDVKSSDKELFGTTLTARSPKQFNINIESLIKNFDVNSQTINEGAVEVKDIVIKSLVGGLAQLEQVAK